MYGQAVLLDVLMMVMWAGPQLLGALECSVGKVICLPK